jgi:flagellar biosynthesis protein FlhF
MYLKWFRGKAAPEVMGQIRRELGPEAVILHTKHARRWGPLRMLGGGGVEILAAVDRSEPTPGAAGALVHERAAVTADSLRTEVATLKNLFVRFGGGRLLPPALSPCYERLVTGGVEPSLVLRLLGELPPADTGDAAAAPPERWVGEALARMIPITEPAVGRPAAPVALVGPAGAGKTTTLAKLAARAQISGGRAGIVNLDGSGLGAPGPLEAFATIVDVPYAAAFTAEAVRDEMGRAPLRGLTLIDTPGVGPGDEAGLARLRELLREARPAEVHLVVSATSKTADVLAAVRAFSVVGATHLLFTHLDETTSCGSVLTVSIETGLPLSYFGTGREIPADLVPADAREVVRRTLWQGDHRA